MSTTEMFVRRVSVSWDDIDRQSRLLALAVRDIAAWRGIIGVARAGLIPATIMAYQLNLRLIDTLCIASYEDPGDLPGVQREAQILKNVAGDGEDMLIVEDIVDTGVTGRMIREMLPKAYFVTIFAKPKGKQFVDKAMIEVAQDTWIDFPWETPMDLAEKVQG